MRWYVTQSGSCADTDWKSWWAENVGSTATMRYIFGLNWQREKRRDERSTLRWRLRLQRGGSWFMNVAIPSTTATKKVNIGDWQDGEKERTCLDSIICPFYAMLCSIPSTVCQAALLMASVKYMRINVPILDLIKNKKQTHTKAYINE